MIFVLIAVCFTNLKFPVYSVFLKLHVIYMVHISIYIVKLYYHN